MGLLFSVADRLEGRHPILALWFIMLIYPILVVYVLTVLFWFDCTYVYGKLQSIYRKLKSIMATTNPQRQ